jgi:ABC-type sugar transport system ATPase subunit
MAALVLTDLSKIFKNDVVGVRGISVEVSEGQLMVLVGPSGSGKSTALRLIAGLEEPTQGDIFIGGRRANDIPPRDRDVAMVFQDYALYPHLNVEQNMGFGLKMRGMAKAEVRSRVMDAARMLGIEQLLGRRPKELSGGQRQRVALGRALVRNPRVFLLDEPLSNLDASLRIQLRREIKEIHRKLGVTMVYVTHDQTEAMALGQRIAVMNAGDIEQVGSPEELYRRPQTIFVAAFFGSPSMNFALCLAELRAGSLELKREEGGPVLWHQEFSEGQKIPRKLSLGFRAEDVRLGDDPDDGGFHGRARVVAVEAMGGETQIMLDDRQLKIAAKVLGYLDIQPGHEVGYSVPRQGLHFFDSESGKRLKIDCDA